jgi:hypothetical protein
VLRAALPGYLLVQHLTENPDTTLDRGGLVRGERQT